MAEKKTINQLQIDTGGIVTKIVTEKNIELYKDMSVLIDDTMRAYWGKRLLLTDDLDTVILMATMCLYDNLYKWDKIIATTKLEYNPIQNYDSDEKETINYDSLSHNDKTYTVKGGTRSSNDTTKYTPNLVSEIDESTTGQVVPYNNNTFFDTDKSVVGSTNKSTGSSDTVVDHTDQPYEDVTTDVGQDGKNDLTVRHLTRAGNIGVTSSQDMIRQERSIADLHIVRDIAHEVVNAISYAVYDF